MSLLKESSPNTWPARGPWVGGLDIHRETCLYWTWLDSFSREMSRDPLIHGHESHGPHESGECVWRVSSHEGHDSRDLSLTEWVTIARHVSTEWVESRLYWIRRVANERVMSFGVSNEVVMSPFNESCRQWMRHVVRTMQSATTA